MKMNMKKGEPKGKKKEKAPSVKIIPLGGLEQIGMNITAFEYEDTIVVVDCGLAFPEDDMLGIDLVIPDVTYLKDNIEKVKGFVITHGHEDHIGALAYVLKDINVPIYATKLTIGVIENKKSCDEIIQQLNGNKFIVSKVEEKELIEEKIRLDKDIIYLSWKSQKHNVMLSELKRKPSSWNCSVWCRIYKRNIIYFNK